MLSDRVVVCVCLIFDCGAHNAIIARIICWHVINFPHTCMIHIIWAIFFAAFQSALALAEASRAFSLTNSFVFPSCIICRRVLVHTLSLKAFRFTSLPRTSFLDSVSTLCEAFSPFRCFLFHSLHGLFGCTRKCPLFASFLVRRHHGDASRWLAGCKDIRILQISL